MPLCRWSRGRTLAALAMTANREDASPTAASEGGAMKTAHAKVACSCGALASRHRSLGNRRGSHANRPFWETLNHG